MRLTSVAAVAFFLLSAPGSSAAPPETVFPLIEAGKYDKAEAILRERIGESRAAEFFPDLLALGFVLMKQARPAEAREVIRSLEEDEVWSKEAAFLVQTFFSSAALAAPPPAPVAMTVPPQPGPFVRIWIGSGTQLRIGRDKFRLSGRGILKNGRAVSSPFELPPGTPYLGRTYRGKLEVTVSRGRLVIVNTLTLEDYLYGVVRNEIAPNWNVEALKAQAIASRTYALRRMGLSENGAPLSADVSIQVYRGIESEDSRVTAAIDETRGLVLVNDDELIEAVFHAESGGRTESSGDLWGRTRSYLVSKSDPYAGESPRAVWAAEFSEEEILRALSKKDRAGIGRIKDVRITEKTAGDRVKTLRISGTSGGVDLPAGKFRLQIGPDRLRSLLWTRMDYGGRKLRIEGRGWGHGVGLPQWSARYAAEQGLTAAEILAYYYAGTRIVRKY
ncbi:SpoIID/LytB domain-containing protein [bacterium]|nr:SpoIID/LytB domain-containing protein [bacterium]